MGDPRPPADSSVELGSQRETTAEVAPPRLGRAVFLVTASSVLGPVVGLVTQPVLAQALGAAGRGEMAAAIAPALLMSSVATLGLPEALTYMTAKRSGRVRRSLMWAILLSVGLGIACLVLGLAALPFLSAGDENLQRLIFLALIIAVPALVIGPLRGVAMGHQMWRVVALESVVSTLLRFVVYLVLWLVDLLTPTSAVLVAMLGPLVAGLVYWRLLSPRADAFRQDAPSVGGDVSQRALQPLVSFGVRVWLGAVAGMLIARVDQVLMVPLSSARDLGLFTVANTISDVPIILGAAISSALMGVNSRSGDADQIGTAARLALLVTLLMSAGLAMLSLFGIGPLFGPEFKAAVVPTLRLLVAAVLYIPGMITGTGLSAAGRPGLRSLGFAVTLVVTVGLFTLLVPHYGVLGACWAGLGSSCVFSGYMVPVASRVLGRPGHRFVLPTRGDCVRLWQEGRALLSAAWTRARGTASGTPGTS